MIIDVSRAKSQAIFEILSSIWAKKGVVEAPSLIVRSMMDENDPVTSRIPHSEGGSTQPK